MNIWRRNEQQVYDERQILERGRAYRYGFVTAVLTFTLFYVLRDLMGIAIDGSAVFISGIWMPLTVCLITLIVKDAYDYVDSTAGRTATAVFGAVGVGLVACCIYEMIWQGESVFRDGVITEQAGSLFMGGCMMLVCAVYWVKQYRDKKNVTEE